MSGSCQYRTQAIPNPLCNSSSSRWHSLQGGLLFQLHTVSTDDLAIHDRRTSSLGCSTSTSSSKGWQSSRTGPRLLPFASITNQQLANSSDRGSSGKQDSRSSSSNSSGQKPDESNLLSQLQQLSPRELQAVIDRSTAKDVFKAGDVLGNGRYHLLDKLGMRGDYGLAEGLPEGRFTTLWDATDMATGKQVVVKCVEGGDSVSYAAGLREAALHAQAGQHVNIVKLLDAFEHRSEHGRHACMVMEKEGSNLYIVEQLYGGRYKAAAAAAAAERDKGSSSQGSRGICLIATPLGRKALRRFAKQTLEALDHLHTKRGLIHMDISSDNILINKPFQHIRDISQQALIGKQGWQRVVNFTLAVAGAMGNKQAMEKLQQQVDAATDDQGIYHEQNLHHATIKITDFGRAVPYHQQQQQQQFGSSSSSNVLDHNKDGLIVMNDPGLRPPEEVLGLDYIAPSYDIWRCGCLMFELATGVPLFSAQSWSAARQRNPALSKYSDDMIHLLDMQTVLGQLPTQMIHRSPLYNELFLRQNDQLKITRTLGLKPRSEAVGKLVLTATDNSIEKKQARGFHDFVTSMLVLDPAKRPSAADMLKHTWLEEVEEEDQQQQQQ